VGEGEGGRSIKYPRPGPMLPSRGMATPKETSPTLIEPEPLTCPSQLPPKLATIVSLIIPLKLAVASYAIAGIAGPVPPLAWPPVRHRRIILRGCSRLRCRELR
jgi:hypothetical protein